MPHSGEELPDSYIRACDIRNYFFTRPASSKFKFIGRRNERSATEETFRKGAHRMNPYTRLQDVTSHTTEHHNLHRIVGVR
jgi:hypothetical protein